MARMPGTIWLGEHSPKRPMERYDVVCVHTIVGFAPAHAAHFSVKADGTIMQSRDTAYRSAANLDGNHRVIAIENEDHGPRFPAWSGSDVPPLTPEQLYANALILRWAHETHGVPLQLCPDSRPGSRGLAYHRQGVDGNFGTYRYPGRVAGGELWTTSRGKVCPGDRRIAQLPQILELAQPEEDWFDMGEMTKAELGDLIEARTNKALWGPKVPVAPGSKAARHYGPNARLSLPNALYWLAAEQVDDADEATVQKIAAKLDEVAAQMAGEQ